MKFRFPRFLRDLTISFRPHRRRPGRRFLHRESRIGAAAEILEDRCLLATLTVNTLSDGVASDDSAITLREAVLLVNDGGDANAALGRSLSPGELAQIDTSMEAFGVNDTIVFDTSLNYSLM